MRLPAATSVKEKDKAETDKVFSYLKYFGYVDKKTEIGPNNPSKGLEKYQKAAQIPETGKLDPKTIEDLRKPRCGVAFRPDVDESVADGRKWDHLESTYCFDNFNEELGEAESMRVLS